MLYDLYDGEVELLSANEHYCQLNGVNAVDLHELRSTFARRAFESDWDEVMEAFEQARENVPNGAVVVVRRMRRTGRPLTCSSICCSCASTKATTCIWVR